MLLRFGVCVGLAVGVTACGSGGTPLSGGTGGLPTSPSQVMPVPGNVDVTRVRVFIKDGRPQAYVEGALGDGCTRLLPITQYRTGSIIVLTLSSVREGEVCTMVMQFVDEWVPLDLPGPGRYVVIANAARLDVDLVATPDGALRVEPDPGPVPQQPATFSPAAGNRASDGSTG